MHIFIKIVDKMVIKSVIYYTSGYGTNTYIYYIYIMLYTIFCGMVIGQFNYKM
jgi:hypothetical protein